VPGTWKIIDVVPEGKSMPSHRFRLTVSLVTLVYCSVAVLGACNFSPQDSEDRNVAVLTSAAKTIDTNSMQLTMMAQSALLTSQAQTLAAPPPTQPAATQPPVEPSPPPVQTEPPPVQTAPPATPIPTVAPLPPQLPKISANVETNCRTGPSPQYPSISFLLVGQQSVVLGTNPDRTWWQIENPKKPGTKCWVWGSTTQVAGDPAAVPVVEPPPPPVASGAPSFQAEFTNIHDCGGVATATFRVFNSGGAPFQSSSILIKDLATDQGIAGPETSNAPFLTSPGGCLPGQAGLEPNNSGFVAKGIGALPPPGTKARAIIVLCTGPSQSVQCVETKVTFVFP
jgi:hypothetical protein